MHEIENRDSRILDAWIARAEGYHVVRHVDAATGVETFAIIDEDGERAVPPYSTMENFGRPIIEREDIRLEPFIDTDGPAQVLATIV